MALAPPCPTRSTSSLSKVYEACLLPHTRSATALHASRSSQYLVVNNTQDWSGRCPYRPRGGSASRPCEVFANFARNLASGFYALPQVKTKHGSKAYERSRHRNDNDNISASPSLA